MSLALCYSFYLGTASQALDDLTHSVKIVLGSAWQDSPAGHSLPKQASSALPRSKLSTELTPLSLVNTQSPDTELGQTC